MIWLKPKGIHAVSGQFHFEVDIDWWAIVRKVKMTEWELSGSEKSLVEISKADNDGSGFVWVEK